MRTLKREQNWINAEVAEAESQLVPQHHVSLKTPERRRTFEQDSGFRRAEAGLPRIRLHDLRHSYAVASLTAGVHPKVISERLGHATVALTLDVYSHVLPSMDEEAAARVAGLILGS